MFRAMQSYEIANPKAFYLKCLTKRYDFGSGQMGKTNQVAKEQKQPQTIKKTQAHIGLPAIKEDQIKRESQTRQTTKDDRVNNMLFLHRLASRGRTVHRLWVSERPNTSSATLLILTTDKDPEVRLSAAEHPEVPYFALKSLVNDPSSDVRFGLAENTHVPVSILESLIEDDNPYVADRAARTLKIVRDTMDKDTRVLCAG